MEKLIPVFIFLSILFGFFWLIQSSKTARPPIQPVQESVIRLDFDKDVLKVMISEDQVDLACLMCRDREHARQSKK